MFDLSYTELRDFRRCPRLYQKKHVEGRKGEEDPKRSFLGDVLGKLVEQFYVQQWWRTPDALDWTMRQAAAGLARQLTDAGEIRWTVEEKTAVSQKIAVAIPLIVAVIKEQKLLSPEVWTEHETVLEYRDIMPHDTVRIHGRIDLLLRRKGYLIVLDAKAGSTIGKFSDRDQLRQYALAIWRSLQFGRIPDCVGFWWLRHGQIKWVKVNDTILSSFEAKLKVTAGTLLASTAYPAEPDGWCGPVRSGWSAPRGRPTGSGRPRRRPSIRMEMLER